MTAQLTVLPGGRGTAAGSAVQLAPHASLNLDQAELFLLSLDAEMTGADLPRAAYLLGLAEGHLASMIELIRALTAPAVTR
jgi:hypothetical protein